jgi:hypothetical protein
MNSWGINVMWEDPIVKEVHEIRRRLAAEHGFDLKAIFADIYERQATLGERLVSPKPQGEPTAEADRDRLSTAEGVLPSEAAPAAWSSAKE